MINRRNLMKAAGAIAVASTVALPAFAGDNVISSGTFEGRSNHETSGSVSIVEHDGRYYVELGDDFSLDGGPDPRVGFGKDGTYSGHDGYLGALHSLNGKQRYAVPIVWDVAQFNEVYIWCDVAGVPSGMAEIK